MSDLYIGLMSGTSTDGIDAVLAELPEDGSIRILAQAFHALPDALRHEFLALNSAGGNELARAALAANALADTCCEVVAELLAQAGASARQVRAIGSHGQTVRHAPEQAYSIQINAPARLAEGSGIAVVADFRSRDIAAGGQGAPLVPAFHAACFGLGKHRAVLNLGGIANLTLLDEPVRGFDTGPANMLMDAWIQTRQGKTFDHKGLWAAQGRSLPALLASFLTDPWFDKNPPKSTGRDHFNLEWLNRHLQMSALESADPADIQASLLQLTVDSVAQALDRYAPETRELIVCGGGAMNTELLTRLQQSIGCQLQSSEHYGLPVNAVEATAFAWLAKAHLEGKQAALASVTGARHGSIAGCLYPA